MKQRWHCRGRLPNQRDRYRGWYRDDSCWQAVSSDGRITVEVAWAPSWSWTGEFVCRVVLDNDWQHPIEEHRTSRIIFMRKWVHQRLSLIDTRKYPPDNPIRPQDQDTSNITTCEDYRNWSGILQDVAYFEWSHGGGRYNASHPYA